jgi:hypothetical protein
MSLKNRFILKNIIFIIYDIFSIKALNILDETFQYHLYVCQHRSEASSPIAEYHRTQRKIIVRNGISSHAAE